MARWNWKWLNIIMFLTIFLPNIGCQSINPCCGKVYEYCPAPAETPSQVTLLQHKCQPNICTEGFKGAMGARGDKGETGTRGQRGEMIPGVEGPPGNPGKKGDPGQKGEMGIEGLHGMIGEAGCPGAKGCKGLKGCQGWWGQPGYRGLPGPKGEKGVRGDQGEPGAEGEVGLPGEPGFAGRNGYNGTRGRPGETGCKGRSGQHGKPGTSKKVPSITRKYIIARHSQSEKDAECPDGSTELWKGFSLFQTEDDGRAVSQDLGSSGSCRLSFDPMPFMFCNINGKCTYASRTGSSYWLSTYQLMTTEPVSGNETLLYISRCVVCEINAPVVVIHNQKTLATACPPGWKMLWTGFSFLQSTTGAGGDGQQLASPGSCLEEFRAMPFIECTSHGTCRQFADLQSYWLVAQRQLDWYGHSPSRIFNSRHWLKKASTCIVCQLWKL